jgi:type IV pilus assembly protein PilO
LKNLSQREKFVVALLLILGVCYIYATFFLLPIFKNISTSRSIIDRYKSNLSQMGSIEASNMKAKEVLVDLTKKYSAYIKKIPLMERDPEIIYNFKLLADKASTHINNIVINDPLIGKPGIVLSQKLFVLPVTLSINANNYISIMNFLNSLEHDKRVAEVQGISIQNTIGSGNQGIGTAVTSVTNANLSVNYYYLESTSPQAINYEFNKGVYGKPDMFK